MDILIVEDDEDMRGTLEHFLKTTGHRVVATAGDGVEAVEKYKEFMPPLVLMDIILPKAHGIDAITEITKVNPKTKIIVITGAQHESLITDAINAGATSYLTKPFGAKELLAEIERVQSPAVNK